jgi:hypothetical protein
MISMERRAEGRLWAALLLPLSLAACNGCQKEKPYNPFGVTTAVPSTDESAVPAAPSAPAAQTKFSPALVAPAGSRKLRMGELTLDAPARYLFDRALVLGEGETQLAVAWVKAEPEAHDVPPGLLMAYDAAGKPRQVMAQPSFVPIAPGCTHATRLVQTGSHSVLVDTTATCPPGMMARVPVEAVSVVAPASDRPEILTLRVTAPAPGEALGIEEDSSDRDGDGREDVKLVFTLTGPEGSKASATLAFVDRAAGVSRDAAEPRASLALATKALFAKTTPATSGEVDATRRLLGTLCAEGATPRVFDAEGSPLRCGDLGSTVDALARADVLSRLAAKDALGAVSVLTRSDWYFKKLSPDAEKAITKELWPSHPVPPRSRPNPRPARARTGARSGSSKTARCSWSPTRVSLASRATAAPKPLSKVTRPRRPGRSTSPMQMACAWSARCARATRRRSSSDWPTRAAPPKTAFPRACSRLVPAAAKAASAVPIRCRSARARKVFRC